MKRLAAVLLLAAVSTGGVALTVATGPAIAGERERVVETGPQLSQHPKSQQYRRARPPQVRGYVQRRGGYSYSYSDGTIDYRDTSVLRDYHNTPRQGGPFDSGFFFDSGINRQHQSPNLN